MSSINITPISGYSPSFTWQVGYANNNIASAVIPTFRATVRPLNGTESYSRLPNSTILYEETGIIINNTVNNGQWTFPLQTNAAISGGPYRDFQVVIEAHDSNGNTSAGNLVGSNNDVGWVGFNQGYDIMAISNPRQTGIELGNNIPTQYTSNTGAGDTGFYLNSGNGYTSLNYMGTHGEINIRYLGGAFNSNLVGGYLYVWTGQFPKREALLSINNTVSGYNGISITQFNFDPTNGYIYSPTAAVSFRGTNQVYVSASFYDNLDQIAIDNGIDISTGLYLSDNALCYNDIAAGSISIGGIQTIYSMQYTGNINPTGILGTGASILSTQFNNGVTSVLYVSSPVIATGGYNGYTGINTMTPGGIGGGAILLNDNPINSTITNFILTLGTPIDDTLAIYLNGSPIKDDNTTNPLDGTSFDLIKLAASSGYILRLGDIIAFSGKDVVPGFSWSLHPWTGNITFLDGHTNIFTGGQNAAGSTDFVPHYRDDGYLVISR